MPARPVAAPAPERPARTWVSAALLLAVTILAFAPTFGAEFIKWTLPVSLLLADWLLQRAGRLPRMRWPAVAARLAPMVLLAGLGGAVSVYFEQQPYTRSFAAEERLLMAANAAWFYVHTFLAPVGLSPVYSEWRVVPSDASWWAPVGLFSRWPRGCSPHGGASHRSPCGASCISSSR